MSLRPYVISVLGLPWPEIWFELSVGALRISYVQSCTDIKLATIPLAAVNVFEFKSSPRHECGENYRDIDRHKVQPSILVGPIMWMSVGMT